MEREQEQTMMDITESSGNVFVDLGLPNAEERALKADIALRIHQFIEQKGWTQQHAAEVLGLDQPKVSNLLRGRLSGFSVERLLGLVTRLGHNVEVRIDPQERRPEEARLSVREA